MADDVLAAVALLGGDARLLDQRSAALVPIAVAVEPALALMSILRSGRRVRLVIRGERRAPIVLPLLRAPAAAAGAAPAPVFAGRLRLPAAIAPPLGWGRLRGRARAPARLLGVLRTANSGVAVQLFADELDDDAANKLADGAA